MNVTINAPFWQHMSGGVRTLHYLGYLCNKLGHSVDLTTPHLNPEWGEYATRTRKHFVPDLLFVPEVDPPTPRHQNTVRWVLYFPGVLAGPTKYPAHELVVPFHPDYRGAAAQAVRREPLQPVGIPGLTPVAREQPTLCPTDLFLPCSDLPGLDEHVDRTDERAYWFGKGPTIDLPPSDVTSHHISRGWPADRRALVRLLKEVKSFYSTDRHTGLLEEAHACGCEVWVWEGWEGWQRWKPSELSVLQNDEAALARLEGFLAYAKKHFGLP